MVMPALSPMTTVEVFRARRRIAPFIRRTPLVPSAWLSDLSGAWLSLKLESLQLESSFKSRGAFNAVSASLQQAAGGVSAAVAGAVIVAAPDGTLKHFNWLGVIVMVVALLSVLLMYFVHKQVPEPAPRR